MSVTDELNELIDLHGGSVRDALNVTLAKLRIAEGEIVDLKKDALKRTSERACGHCGGHVVQDDPYCLKCRSVNPPMPGEQNA